MITSCYQKVGGFSSSGLCVKYTRMRRASTVRDSHQISDITALSEARILSSTAQSRFAKSVLGTISKLAWSTHLLPTGLDEMGDK